MGYGIDGMSIASLSKVYGIGRSKMREILFEVIPKEEIYTYSNATIFPKKAVNKYADQIQEKVNKAVKNKASMSMPKKFIVGMSKLNLDEIEDDVIYTRKLLGKMIGVSSQTVKRVESRFIDEIYYNYEIIGEGKKRFLGYGGPGVRNAAEMCKNIVERKNW